MCCSVGEVSQDGSSERIQILGSASYSPPHRRIHLAGIHGSDQKVPYLVWSLQLCARIRDLWDIRFWDFFLLVNVNCPIHKSPLSDVQTWHPLWMLRNNFAYFTAGWCPHIDPATKIVIFSASFHSPWPDGLCDTRDLMLVSDKLMRWYKAIEWYPLMGDHINKFPMALGSWWWSYGVHARVGSEEGFGVWGASGGRVGSGGDSFCPLFCLFSPAFIPRFHKTRWTGLVIAFFQPDAKVLFTIK